MERMFVSIREACTILSLGRSTIYRMIGENELDTVKIGRRRLITMAAIKTIGNSDRRAIPTGRGSAPS